MALPPSCNPAILSISAGTTNATGPQVVFSNSNGVSFGVSGNTVTASVIGGGGDTDLAVSANGNSVSAGTLVFSNSNNVSFGMAGSTITASATASQSTAPSALAAGTQTATSGTVVFANSNGLTFGMSGSTQITGSYSQSTSPGGLAAGTQTATSGTVVFSNSNNISFGMSNSSVITASFSQTVQPGVTAIGVSNIGNTAGNTGTTQGTYVFAGAGGVTLSQSTAAGSLATLSISMVGPAAISAAGASASSGTVVFSNSNNISFGMNGNTVTASASDFTHSFLYPAGQWPLQLTTQNGQNSLVLHAITAEPVAFSLFAQRVLWSGTSNSTATISYTFQVGVYTKSISSMSLVMSTSFNGSINHSGNINNSLYASERVVTVAWTSTLNRGDYYIGLLSSTTFSSQNVNALENILGSQPSTNFVGVLGNVTSASVQEVLGLGHYSLTTGAMPSSIAFSDIIGTGANDRRAPIYYFGQTV
jgi:hypothetical protein